MEARLLLIGLLAVLFVFAGAAGAAPAEVVLRPGETHQTIEGFGGSMVYWFLPDSYVDPGFYDMLVYDLGVSLVRLPMPPNIEPWNDDDDPDHINWDAVDLSKMAPRMEWLSEFKKRGVSRFTTSLWSPPDFMKTNRVLIEGGKLRPDMRDEFAEFLTIFLKAAKAHWDIEFMSLSPQNELYFKEWYYSCIYNPAQIREAVRAISRKFRREGITTKLMMPEDMAMQVDRLKWFIRPTMEDPETRDFPGFFCVHGKPDLETWQSLKEFLAPYDRQLWMTETGGGARGWNRAMANATAIHNALAGGDVNAWTFWQLTSLIDGHTPRTGYWPAKHFYRFVRPGAVRISAESADEQLLASAYHHPDSGKLTAVLINRSEESVEVAVKGGGQALPESFRLYVSDEEDQWVPREAEAGEGAVRFSMPPESMATLQSGPEDDLRELALTDEVAGPEELRERIQPPEHPRWKRIKGWTPLHMATLWGHWNRFEDQDMVQFLLESGADVNEPADDGWTPMHMAASAYNEKAYPLLRHYISKGGDVNAATADGWTVLHAAVINAWTGYRHDPDWTLDRVRACIEHGAELEARDGAGRTPLHWGAWVGYTLGHSVVSRVVDTLIEAGADVNARDDAGLTPLHYACLEGYPAIVQSLVDAGADATLQDEEGRTPADIARMRGFEEILGILEGETEAAEAAPEQGRGDRGALSDRGGPQLRGAAAAGNVDSVKSMLERGVHPDAMSPNRRRTALHAAAAAGHMDVVKALIAAGADADARDSDGFTPADRARENGHDEVAEVLSQTAD